MKEKEFLFAIKAKSVSLSYATINGKYISCHDETLFVQKLVGYGYPLCD
jgi:hypothetical protein